jgi:hypothetical protein
MGMYVGQGFKHTSPRLPQSLTFALLLLSHPLWNQHFWATQKMQILNDLLHAKLACNPCRINVFAPPSQLQQNATLITLAVATLTGISPVNPLYATLFQKHGGEVIMVN